MPGHFGPLYRERVYLILEKFLISNLTQFCILYAFIILEFCCHCCCCLSVAQSSNWLKVFNEQQRRRWTSTATSAESVTVLLAC